MKKALKIVTLILAVCMTATFMFGCSLFGSIDPKDAKKNLKEADYEVELIDDEDDLEEVAEEMELDGTIVAVITAVNLDDEFDTLTAVLFEDKADAKDFAEEAADKIQESIEEMEEMGAPDEYIEAMEAMKPERIGKWVVMGTEDAIEAFKG